MREQGDRRLLMNPMLFIIFLVWCCVGCQYASPHEQKAAEPQSEGQDLVILTIDGDTIPTGEPFPWAGKSIAAADRPPPKVLPSKTTTIPANLLEEVPLTRADVRHWLDTLPTFIPGKNGVPLPLEISLKPDTFKLPLPSRHEARSFRRKSLSTSRFETLTTEEGLPVNLISSMVEDANGHYWMGCEEGIIRFDGKEFLFYNLTELADFIQLHAMMKDRRGAIWFVVANFGLKAAGKRDAVMKFDGHHLVIYDFGKLNQESSIQLDPKENIYSHRVIEDQRGRIWVASDFGLVRVDGSTCRLYTTEHGLLERWALNLHADKNGLLWITHTNGVTGFKEGRFVQYRHDLELRRPDFLISWPSIMDAKANIWFFKDQLAYVFSNDSLVSYRIPIPLESAIGDAEGHIWGATGAQSSADRNLFKVNTTQLSTTKYSKEEGLIHNFHYPLLWDSKGSLWLRSSTHGVQRFSPQKIRYHDFEDIPVLADITNIVQEPSQDLWLGLHHPAIAARFDGKNYTFFNTFYENYLHGHISRDLYLDRKGHLWMGAFGFGVYKWDKTQLLAYTPEQGLSGDQVYAMTEDGAGSMWFGTWQHGLTKFDGVSWVQYQLDNQVEVQERRNYLDVNTIRALLTDRNGQVWAGSYGGGLIKFDEKNTTIYTTAEGLSDNMVVSLLEDREGYIWAGTVQGGVNRFDPEDSALTFDAITTEDGLSSNEIWTITEDSAGNIWLGADRCLNLLLRKPSEGTETSFKVIDYCQADGLPGGEYYANATYRDSKNRIWWGSSATLQMLPPDVYPIRDTAGVELTAVNVAQTAIDFRDLADSIAWGEDYRSGENKAWNFVDMDFKNIAPFQNYPLGLKLPHYFNHLTFRFSATHHRRLDLVRFSYFIEGIDNEWSKPSTENRAEYRGVPPGNHTFRVKAAGLEGHWGPVFSYDFTIRPPWWRSNWAYLLWALLAGAGIYSLYIYFLQRQLERAETRRTKELDYLKSRLYTNITHEFRTPLTVIMGMSEQLGKNAAELPKSYREKMRSGLHLIQRNGQNLLHLINQLLDLSKLDSGKLKLKMTQGDIVAYLQYLTESFYSMAEDKDIRLTFYAEEESLLMDYDEEKIQQIVYNLLSNAIKFTPERGKVIFHILKLKRSTSEQLQMKVKDTGVGMSPEDVRHVFDRFYQADGSSTRKGEGTGIGLALTKELVELMNGEIQVESTPDKGSTFTIHLPISREYPLRQNIPARQIRTTPSFSTAGPFETLIQSAIPGETSELPTLLIIEDNVDVALYIKTLLEGKYTIHVAENGQIGIDRAIELVPDIIISDVMMPEKDGYEVCYTLKQDERTSHIPIILLTARASQEDRIDGLHHGADAYLTKPFQKRELMVRLKSLVELRQKLQKRYSANSDLPRATPTDDDKESQFLHKLRETVVAQMDQPDFSASQLAEVILMSQTQVYRKLKALTDQTPSQFIRSIRLQRAKELLKTTDLTISEIAYEVGFSDPNYFSRTFNKAFHIPPRDFRKYLTIN